MKKVELSLLIVACLGTSSAIAGNNLFEPKQAGVSNEDIDVIVQEKLDEQKFQMENEFLDKIDSFQKDIKQEQETQFNTILESLEKMKAENAELNKRKSNRVNDRTILTSDDVNEELSYLLEDNVDEDSFILTDDIIRLNKEYGEAELSFVGIIDEHKIYKNKDGEYIVKGLDFDYSQFRAEEAAEKARKAALEDSKPPRSRK